MAAAAAPRAFTLRPGTRLVLQRADLTKFPFSGSGEGCAIVNAANERCAPAGRREGVRVRRRRGGALPAAAASFTPTPTPAPPAALPCRSMLGGGGVDGSIHRAAGPALLEACRAVPEARPGVRCPTGEARITPGGSLPAQHVIHTVRRAG